MRSISTARQWARALSKLLAAARKVVVNTCPVPNRSSASAMLNSFEFDAGTNRRLELVAYQTAPVFNETTWIPHDAPGALLPSTAAVSADCNAPRS